MRRLIVTADDFGRALPVNEAVEDANRRGILTAASLMVAGDAAADAVARAKALPGLSVGLHATLVDGTPVLPAADIPALVGSDGRFTLDLVRLGVTIFFSAAARRQVEAELRAQFERYAETGLALGHVDSHHHYHLHPTVFDILLKLALEYGAPAIRVPWEPPLRAATALGERALPHLAGAAFHYGRVARMRRKIAAAGLVANDAMFGLSRSGKMDRAAIAAFVGALPEGVSELYTHPATGPWTKDPLPAGYRAADEYQALVDPGIMALVRAGRVELTSFSREAARRTDRGQAAR